jgi:probable HAF family extracellular repeat protein
VENHALLWEKDGTVTDLGGAGGIAGNHGCAVNNEGEVVGPSELLNNATFHGFLWTRRTGMQDLGTFSEGAFVTVAPCCDTINDRGQIVGFSVDAEGMHGFLWQDNAFTDLKNLIPEDSPWHLSKYKRISFEILHWQPRQAQRGVGRS